MNLPDSLLPAAPSSAAAYARDALERSVLFLDTLRRRGNIYVDHVNAGEPALLDFPHALVLDGRSLARPCNYALLRVLPPADAPVDPGARPVVVVDPRAGHGPGIGGFKKDSEVGVAMRAGHPVYFVTFRPEPEEGQTLLDIMQAEAQFLEEVARRHPDTDRPVVIGNCQAGWAIASLAAVRPELFGPLMVVGSPMSYWAGGAKLNPMRYTGAVLGGAWLASLVSDLGADRFDGAHLVQNFENLNPANTWWSKYHRLWSHIDDEAERFLAFERWWGGFFRMTGAEIETIVENLFVGNRLARGDLLAGDDRIDLRRITAPVVVFASWGDNITPPPQALDWIIDTWGSERAIAAAGRVIVYVLHENVGHLGIFVGADIARKEHDQIVHSLDVIEALPPGLYEMKVRLKQTGAEAPRWDVLEPGTYTVQFEHRTMDDLRAVNPEGRDEERLFASVARLSEMNSALYKTWVRPWLRPLASRPVMDAAIHLHPLRLQRQLFSDAWPGAAVLEDWAARVRADRHPVDDDHLGRLAERQVSSLVESGFNLWRDWRDQAVVQWTRAAYGPLGLAPWLPPGPADERVAAARARADLAEARADVIVRLDQGGFAQAVCRIVLAGIVSTGTFERRSLRLARALTRLPAAATGMDHAAPVDWRRLMRDEARIRAVAPVEALGALGRMLPDLAGRERALAAAAAVLMIEPTLDQPDSEIVELLIGLLDVDPARVMAQARALTAQLDLPDGAAAPVVAAPTPAASARRPRAAGRSAGAARPAARSAARHATPRT